MTDIESILSSIEAALKAGPTPGPWVGLNMVNMDGSAMSAEDLGLYVKNSVLKTAATQIDEPTRFLFLSTDQKDGPDICHIGNGLKGPANWAFIAAANPQALSVLVDAFRKMQAERDWVWNEALRQIFPMAELHGVDDDACINLELCEQDDGSSRCVASFSLGQIRALKRPVKENSNG